MAEPLVLRSALAPYIYGLLEEKRSLGFDYHTEALILARLDSYCYDMGLKEFSDIDSHLLPWCT